MTRQGVKPLHRNSLADTFTTYSTELTPIVSTDNLHRTNPITSLSLTDQPSFIELKCQTTTDYTPNANANANLNPTLGPLDLLLPVPRVELSPKVTGASPLASSIKDLLSQQSESLSPELDFNYDLFHVESFSCVNEEASQVQTPAVSSQTFTSSADSAVSQSLTSLFSIPSSSLSSSSSSPSSSSPSSPSSSLSSLSCSSLPSSCNIDEFLTYKSSVFPEEDIEPSNWGQPEGVSPSLPSKGTDVETSLVSPSVPIMYNNMAPILGLNQTLSDNTNLASLLSEPMFEGDYTLKADRLTFHEPSHVKIPCTFTRETKSMIVMNKLVQSESEVISTSKPSQSSSSTPASIKTTSRKNTTITSPGITITTSPTNARPIVVDNPKDAASVRRARNTEAARRSRAKKTDRIRELELMVDQLMEHNTKLQCEVEVLRQYKWHV